jgi:hypothetical protein
MTRLPDPWGDREVSAKCLIAEECMHDKECGLYPLCVLILGRQIDDIGKRILRDLAEGEIVKRTVVPGATYRLGEDVDLLEVPPIEDPPSTETQGEPWGWTKPGPKPRGWRKDGHYDPK